MIQEMDSETLRACLQAGEDLALIDIRTDAELIQGMLPNAAHLPMHLIPLRMGELPKDKPVVLYCRSGARSYHACAYLLQHGYPNFINLRGGIIAWAVKGFDLERPVGMSQVG